MRLIDLFSDYIRNKKDLLEYIEKRKDINERGEFNDENLRKAAQKLQRLKEESPQIYEGMHETLEEYYKRDEGHYVEYPINFLRQILMMFENHVTVEQVYESYKKGLDHHCRDAYN
eukprot:Anaeramoba_ignava/a619315_14.p1 GENE.a619315_14~~a619315_14.p1  ORF type:complete len:116 (-),score=3.60 a619315_14:161-508(-)